MAEQNRAFSGWAGLWYQTRDTTVRACRSIWNGRPESAEEAAATEDEQAPLEYGPADRAYKAATRWFSYLAGAALGVIVVICVFDIISWKFFNWPFPSQQGLVMHLNVVLVFLAVAFVQMDRGSISIELLQAKLPRGAKLAIRVFSSILGAGVSLFAAYRGWYYLSDLYSTHAVDTGVWRFPIWPFQAALVLGWLLLGIAFLFTIGRDVTNFRMRRGSYATCEPGRAEQTASAPVD